MNDTPPRISRLRVLYLEFLIRPMATAMTSAATFVGVCALILGEGASRAFTIIGGGPHGGALIIHVMGALMAGGGVLTLVGVLRPLAIAELLGLGLVSAGALIYGAGVLIGLGTNGLVAGGLSLGLSVGAALRVVLLAAEARRLFNAPG